MNLPLECRFLAQFVTTIRGPVIATMGDGFKILAITREDVVSSGDVGPSRVAEWQ